MALTTIDDRGLKTPIDLLDNEEIRFGTGNDLKIWHNGNHSYIQDAGTGNLYIDSIDGNIYIRPNQSETGISVIENGAVILAYDNSPKLETTSSGVTLTGDVFFDNATNAGNDITWDMSDNLLEFTDDTGVSFGDGKDLQIYHNGTNSHIENGTGELLIRAKTSENSINCNPDAGIEIFYDNSKKFETKSYGADVTGYLQVGIGGGTNGLLANDSVKLRLGNDQDLEIWHDGTDSIIAGGTDLLLRPGAGNNDIIFQPNSGAETMLKATVNGAVELYYDNEKRIETGGIGAKISHDGDTSLQLSDTSANAVSNWITAKTAGYAEYNCYKEGVGTKYPHVFVGYTTEYARIDDAGIKFNGDTATANALDDYEEGTWTPSVMFGGTSTGITYGTANGGSYVKIGRQVILHGRVNTSNKGSSTGNATIGGFPFSAGGVQSGTSGIEGDAFFSYLHDIVGGEDHAHVMAWIQDGETQMKLNWNDNSGDYVALTHSNFENDTSLSFTAIYPVA